MNTSFHLLISNPERTFYDGQVASLSTANKSGPYDILPDHAHFISLIADQTVSVIDDKGKKIEYKVVRGLLSAKENQVRVFVDL